jgi:hypothetical protein
MSFVVVVAENQTWYEEVPFLNAEMIHCILRISKIRRKL